MNRWSRVKDFLLKDVGWKLLSLVIAVSLWFIVINITNPSETRNYYADVEIRNIETITGNNQVISNLSEIQNSKVTIKIKAQRLTLDKLTQISSQIEAYVDVASIDWTPANGDIVPLPITIKIPSSISVASYEIENRSPSNIQFVIENTKSIELTIEPSFIGTPSAEYTTGVPEITPSTVVISGTEDMVNSVVGAKVLINAETITEDQIYQLSIIPYNASDVEVLGVSLSQDVAQVYIPVKSSKKLPIVVETIGEPMIGYVLDTVTAQPESVYVTGDDEVLRSINEITLPAVNIAGRNADLETSFVLRYVLPEGVSLKAGEPERVVVTATLAEESAKDVVLMEENVSITTNLPDNLSAEILLEDITLQVKGLEEILSLVANEDITATLTVSETEAGEYRLPLMVTVPEGVRLTEAESPYVTVIITDNTAEPEAPEENIE